MSLSCPEGKDIVVIGSGHAGCEAALAAARSGADTLLLTVNCDHTAQMSCNPAIGGIAKGQVVREIDALGGEMGVNTDAATLQFRMINNAKGPAVHSPRAQCDKVVYQQRMKQVLEKEPNLLMHQARVTAIRTDGKSMVTGVVTEFNDFWPAKAVIIATGTFLAGKLHFGMCSMDGGRAGDPAALELSRSLAEDLHLETGRLKTGTPPRLLGRTIDFSKLERQNGDAEPGCFSFNPDRPRNREIISPELPALPCYLTETNKKTAAIVRENISQSPLYQGRINGIGARYCPSFEDKIVRFPDRESHQIYLEPEGAFTEEYYLNGISTSLPSEVQWRMVRSLPGLEKAEISRYGYAIEYDFVYPRQLDISLACRHWPNLFLAGQINGTSGYEEAAGQGLVAGINAVRLVQGNSTPFVLKREQAYIGVMIDDLVTKEITEPYRLFTSRAEYRLMLRQDNAHRRLTPVGYDVGLIGLQEYREAAELEDKITAVKEMFRDKRTEDGNTLWELLRRPGISYDDLPDAPQPVPPEVKKQVEIDALYEGYIKRQGQHIQKMHDLASWTIPAKFDYAKVQGLRKEARDKLIAFRPRDLAQASRIDGVTPAEISILQIYLR